MGGVDALSLADAALGSGTTQEGERLGRECLELARRIDDRPGIVYGLAILAWAAAQRGDAARAAALWSGVESEERSAPIPRWETERERYARHLPKAAGAEPRLSLEEASERALSDG